MHTPLMVLMLLAGSGLLDPPVVLPTDELLEPVVDETYERLHPLPSETGPAGETHPVPVPDGIRDGGAVGRLAVVPQLPERSTGFVPPVCPTPSVPEPPVRAVPPFVSLLPDLRIGLVWHTASAGDRSVRDLAISGGLRWSRPVVDSPPAARLPQVRLFLSLCQLRQGAAYLSWLAGFAARSGDRLRLESQAARLRAYAEALGAAAVWEQWL